MIITLTSTTKIVTLEYEGGAVPARVWEGVTDSGIPCHAYITRIAVHRKDDERQFERELMRMRDPINPDVRAIPARLIIG